MLTTKLPLSEISDEIQKEQIIFKRNGFNVLLLNSEEYENLKNLQDWRFKIVPLPENKMLYAPSILKSYPYATDPAIIQSLVDQVDETSYGNKIKQLADLQTRYLLIPNFSNVTNTVMSMFEEVGYETTLDPFEYSGNTYN